MIQEAVNLIKERYQFCIDIQKREISEQQKKDYWEQKEWWAELLEMVAGGQVENKYEKIIENTLEVYVGEQYNRYLRLTEILAIKEGFEERGDEISEEDALMFEKIADSINTTVDEIEKTQRAKEALDNLINNKN